MDKFELFKQRFEVRLEQFKVGFDDREDFDRGQIDVYQTVEKEIARVCSTETGKAHLPMKTSYLHELMDSSLIRLGCSESDARTFNWTAFEMLYRLGILDLSKLDFDTSTPDEVLEEQLTEELEQEEREAANTVKGAAPSPSTH